MIAALHAVLPEEATVPIAGDVDWSLVKHVLDELEPLLDNASMQANLLFETYAGQLKTALGTLGVELEQRIELFLYPEALETLKRARKKHSELHVMDSRTPN